MKPLKLAVIGAGHLGRIHARLIGSLENVQLAAIVDPDDQARDQAAQQYRTRAFAHHHDLIGQIDAAVVATPTQYHHAVGLELLEHGIHLLVEKPLSTTVGQADELVAAATAAKAILQVGHVERFNPALTAAVAHLQQPKYIEAVRTSGYTCRSTDIGVVLDLMVHDLDVILSLLRSPVASVEALGISLFGNHEDMAQARLTFENGCVANLSASRTSFESLRKMQIFAERAYVGIDFAARTAKIVRPSEMLLNQQIDVEQLSPVEKSRFQERLFSDLLPIEDITAPSRNALLDELDDFVTCIRTGHTPQVSGQQGRDVLRVAQQILDKIAAHRWTAAADGPAGALLKPPAPILQGPHRSQDTQRASQQRRKAG